MGVVAFSEIEMNETNENKHPLAGSLIPDTTEPDPGDS